MFSGHINDNNEYNMDIPSLSGLNLYMQDVGIKIKKINSHIFTTLIPWRYQ